MKQLQSQLKRAFYKKSGLSKKVFSESFEALKDNFLEAKDKGDFDLLLSVAEKDGKFGIFLIDDGDEFYSNTDCISQLKAIWGQDFKHYIDKHIPSIVEEIEKGSIFTMGFILEEEEEDDDEYMITSILKDVISLMKKEAIPVVSDQNLSMIIENCLTPTLIEALASYLCQEQNSKQEETVDALVEILIPSLDEIRMSAENGIADSKEVLDICLHVIKQNLENTGSQEFGAIILKILSEAKIKPTSGIIEFIEEVFSEADFSPEQAYSSFAAMIEHHDCPFELLETVFSSVGQLGEEAKINIITLLLQQEDQIAKDAACLSVLDENPIIRSFILKHLLNHYKSAVSGESLGRFVAIRNWLSEKDQSDLDKIIVKCKKANIVIPPVDSYKITDLYGSIVDGSGGQGIWGLAEKDSKCINFGIFFKLGFGFRDFWFNTDFDEEQANEFRTLIVSNPEASVQKISIDCMHSIIRYYLYYHTKYLSYPPQALLLKVTETLGLPIWVPDDGLIELMPNEELNLNKKDVIPDSWFYSQECIESAALGKGSKTTKIKKIFTHLSKKERLMWIENFRIASILSFHCPEIELPSPQTLVNSMIALEKDIPASEIPIMKKIAEQTVEVASCH